MAEERTEKATPKRREEARERGQVARSQELNTGMSLLGFFVLLAVFGDDTYQQFSGLMVETFVHSGQTGDINPASAWALAMDLTGQTIRMVAPYAAGAFVIALVASVVQVKPQISLKVIQPKFSVLSPKTGIKRLFSIRTLATLIKDILKLTIVGSVTWLVLRGQIDTLIHLMGADPRTTLGMVASLLLKMGLFIGGAYMVMAVADVIYERWQYERDMRMTKDEVKRESKEADISPEVKGQLKRRQREMAMRRMMAAIPDADVVITNPTHYAVALKYARNLPAPQVVAKGQDNIALRIRAAAEEHGVRIVEDPPLARSLHATVEVGQYIPGEAFAAVAEILAAVYRASGKEPAVA